MSRFVSLGHVVKPKGLRGELKIKLLAPEAASIEGINPLYLVSKGRREPVWVERLRPEGRGWCLKLKGLDTVEAAEARRNAEIEIEEERLPALPAGSFYHFELVDCAVVDEQGTPIGTVASVESLPTCDTLWVSRGAGPEIPVPLVKSVLRSVDLPARRVTVAAGALAEMSQE